MELRDCELLVAADDEDAVPIPAKSAKGSFEVAGAGEGLGAGAEGGGAMNANPDEFDEEAVAGGGAEVVDDDVDDCINPKPEDEFVVVLDDVTGAEEEAKFDPKSA